MVRRIVLVLSTWLLLVSCTTQMTRTPMGRQTPAVPPQAAQPSAPGVPATTSAARTEPVSPAAPLAAERSNASSRDGYRKDFAEHIYRANAQHLYTGRPPPLLKSVIVLNLRVDAGGNPTHISIRRSNGVKALEALAMQSVRNAAPLPIPSRLAQSGGGVEFLETWLFRNDGRFQLHTLAEPQATE